MAAWKAPPPRNKRDRRSCRDALAAESLGTAFLLAAVVGSGIMAQKLAGGNVALALLCNTLPTGAILVVLILIFGPVSGAHFNPAVSARVCISPRVAAWPTRRLYHRGSGCGCASLAHGSRI